MLLKMMNFPHGLTCGVTGSIVNAFLLGGLLLKCHVDAAAERGAQTSDQTVTYNKCDNWGDLSVDSTVFAKF